MVGIFRVSRATKSSCKNCNDHARNECYRTPSSFYVQHRERQKRYRQRYLDLIVNDDSRKVFQQRIAIIREIRRFMEERGFMEVETPMLQAIAGGASANPFKTYYEALNAPMYMRIAPELYLKRLLVGGFEKVF